MTLPVDPAAVAGWVLADRLRVPVAASYRLDLTVAVLRRTAANLVDVWTDDGRYLRATVTPHGPQVHAVTQARDAKELEVAVYVPAPGPARRPSPPALGLEPRLTLGTRVDLAGFYAAARGLPLLWPLVESARGVRPPRYTSLWEAICNSVMFQQVSLEAAIAVMGRMVAHFGDAVRFGPSTLHSFPEPAAIRDADPMTLRGFGLSASKARTLRDAADAIIAGRLTDEEIEGLSTAAASVRLTREWGIGHWTASVILLRGFGRLDVFPLGDSGARRGLRNLRGVHSAGGDPDATELLDALGPWRGMLYYHLLLQRLQRRGEVDLGTPSTKGRAPSE